MACFKFKFQEDGFSYQGTKELEVEGYDTEDDDAPEVIREQAWMTRPAEPDEKPADLAPEEGGEIAL